MSGVPRSSRMRSGRSMHSSRPSGSSQFRSSARSGMASGLSGSRYSYASRYSNTNQTPLGREVAGVPISTITATGLAAVFYTICIITILATDCPFSREVIYFFTFLLVALIALASMAGINMLFTKYRFNCLSLTISLLFSGSAALILLGLIESAVHGLCWPSGDSESSTTSVITPTVNGTTQGNKTFPMFAPLIEGTPRNSPLKPGPGPGPVTLNTTNTTGSTTTTTTPRPSWSSDYPTEGSLFTSGFVPNFIVWFSAAIGLCFQLVAHYYYG